MLQKTKSRWLNIWLRLSVFIALLIMTPFFIIGMRSEGHGGSMWFLVVFLVVVLPDVFIKLFLRPIAVAWDEKQFVFSYLIGPKRRVKTYLLVGYKNTEEPTRYALIKGICLYIGPKKRKLRLTDLNIRDIAALNLFLDNQGVHCYGKIDVKPWFLFSTN